MDVDTDACTRLERGECPRCRFVATTATSSTATETTTATTGSSSRRAIADGGRELEAGSEVSDR